MQDFKKLTVWQKAHELALEIYQTTSTFPKEEIYGLTSQLRRASVSIPSNIAEGCGRAGNAELVHFLHIALGSASEIEYQILLAHDLGFIESTTYEKLFNDVVQVKKMLGALIAKLKN